MAMQVDGEAFERLLFEAGITQEDFATLAGVHSVTVSRHKTGAYQLIRADAAAKLREGLAKALRRPVGLDEFIYAKDEKVPAA